MRQTTILLLLLSLTSAGVTHAQQPHELPDSTYLKLTLDLPVLGTFSYDVVSAGGLRNVHGEVRNVAVERCTLSFEIWMQQLPRHWVATYAIPLRALDARSMSIRAAHAPRNTKYEPQPWLLRLAVRSDSESRILTGTRESPHQRPTRRVDLTVKDYETGTLIKAWLLDGANRCETWNTTPIKAVR